MGLLGIGDTRALFAMARDAVDALKSMASSLENISAHACDDPHCRKHE